MGGRNWIKDLVDEKKVREAQARALALTAYGAANPTEDELKRFVPGQPIEGMAGTTGASPTDDMAGATADLQAQLRNEELGRMAEANAPAVQALRTSIALGNAGLNEVALGHAAEQRIKLPVEQARADTVRSVLINPDADPLLKADIADRKPVFKTQLVKVRRQDGTEMYMHQRPTLSGEPEYSPALDDDGNPLQVPIKAGGGSGGPTALQKNAAFLARVLFADDPEAEKKAVGMLTTLKGKAPADAWDSLTREVSRLQYGRYAKDPQRLFEKTAEIWRVARPMEPLPRDAPAGAMAPLPPSAAPSPGAAARAPAPTLEPTAVNPKTGERLVFRNGQWQPHK